MEEGAQTLDVYGGEWGGSVEGMEQGIPGTEGNLDECWSDIFTEWPVSISSVNLTIPWNGMCGAYLVLSFSTNALIVSTIPPSPLNITTVCSFPSFAASIRLNLVSSLTESVFFVLITLYLESSNPVARNSGCSISSKNSCARPVPDRVDIKT